jgi:hypothetical protein
MPIAHYIIGCQSRSDDKLTGLASHFGVVEAFDVIQWDDNVPERYKRHLEATRVLWFSASWMRTNGDDPQQVYEGHWIANAPGRPAGRIISPHEFAITRRTYRNTIKVTMVPKERVSGIHVMEHRIRKHGSSDAWISQSFPFWVDYAEPAQ